MNYDLFIQNIKKNVAFSKPEIEKFCGYFKPKDLKKKEFLLKQGSVCKFEGFVLEGCFRIYTVDKKGNENALYFAAKDWWIMDSDSFMNERPSDLNIQALENSKILVINRSDKLKLYQEIPKAEKLFRIMFQKAVVAWQRRVVSAQTQTAKERFEYFIAKYPTIATKLTDKQIASYLGITHEFLSKIKKR